MKDLTYITYRVKNILILICTMSMMHQVAIAQVSPSERQALIDLYNATDGDNWSNTIAGNQPWLVNDPTSLVSDWFGVSVVDGKITSLSLVGNNLKGEIPTSFGDLVSLTFLNLGINRLTGQLPQSIGNLTSLEVLQLTRNTLTGGVPSSIGNLTNLIQIDFSINQLTLPLPDVFTNLINAKTFTVERNAITGTIPPSIGSMISLETLILGSNQLTGSIPSELGNLSNLTYLGLYVNGLSGEIPDSLGNLSKLERLLLFRNALTGEVPVSLGNLSNLKGLDVNSNQLTGSIPNEFGSLANLEVLTLSINKFSGNLPQGLSSLASADILNTLVFERNNFVFSDFELQFRAYNDNLTTFSYLNQGQVDQIETRSVVAGQSITLTSNVLTSTNNRYQWFKNNVAIPGATNKDLVISNALDSDAGVYHFTATNNIIADLSLRRNPITLEISCGVSEAEKQALIDLYNSTNGPNWTSSNNWLTDAPVCDWTGVTVKDGKVTGLYLFGGGVAGPLPASIGDLVHLTSLTITRSGGLSGAIPLTIGNLVNLETINLTSNQLTGEIPVEIGNLTNLVSLQLARNQLSGSIPSSIGNLTKLISIGISENRFTGDIPSSIGGLTELEKFDVSINQLNGSIPPELGNLTGLTQLGLTRNALTGSIPVTLSNLVNLTTLDLSSNALTGVIPSELGTMNNLKTLNLFRNQLSGSIPSELGNLQNLESLNLFSNGLTGAIPLSFGNLSNLIVLQLYRNQLSGSIPEALGNLTKLTTLGLSTNQLSGSVPPNFGILASSDILNTLTLDRNNFVFNNFETEFPVYQSDLIAFNYLTQAKVDEIETLSVTENASITLTSTELTSGNNSYQWYKNNTAIPGATSNDYIINNAAATDAGVYYFTATNSVVTDLTLERNPITVTVTEGIADCVSAEEKAALVALYNSTDGANWTNNVNWLSNEPVSEWAGVIVEDCKVTRLFLGDNNLVGVLPNEIGDLINLEQLHLNTNSVSSTIPDQIGNLSNLKLLYLYGNEISGVLPESIGNLTNLNNLSLASNKLEGNIPSSFSNLTNIIALSLGGNIGITGDVSFLFKLPNISSLEVWSCNLTEEFTTDFDYVNTSLTKLIISNNGLTGVFDFGKYMPNLQNLSAQDNELNGEFSAYGFTELLNIERLYIERNQIFGSIPVGPKLENLIRLDFSENNLEGQIPDIFTDSSLMRDFQMNNNRFSGKLPLFGVNSLTKVYVFHNNFVYDDFQASYNDAAFSYNFQAALEAAPDQTISKGDTLTILANERLLEDNNQYAWFKSDDGGATFVNTGITSKDYSKENVDVDDAGIYKLQITNPTYPGVTLAQEATSITIDLDTCGVSDAEKQALVDLYNSTDGANWTNNTNWLTDAPVCDWYGVTVENRKITKLELVKNNLSGTISNRIGDLPSLTILNLSNNSLIGEIPIEIGSLTDLNQLNLSINEISGSIPFSIGSLNNLTYLSLLSNSLTGQIPLEMGNLSNLTILYLGRNQLTGNIPSELGNLRSLQYLGLIGNQLTGSIPPQLGQISGLLDITLSNNQLSGDIPAELGNLSLLQILNLGYNQFTGSIPVELENLINLRELILRNNNFEGQLPLGLDQLNDLRIIYIENNKFQGIIPFQIINLPYIFRFYIQNNGYVFNEIEVEYDEIQARLGNNFIYAPQADVDQEETIEVQLGGSVTLATTQLTSTNNTYTWYKGTDVLIETTLPQITIDNITAADLGEYYFTATNSVVNDLTLTRNNITLVLGNTDPDGCDILEGVVDGSFENCLSVAGPISEENFNRTIDCSNWELTSVFPVNPLFQSSISTWFVDGNSSNMPESQFSEYISSSPDGGVFTSSFLEIQRRLSKGNGFKTTLNDLTIGEEYIISFYQSHGGSFDDLNGIAVFSDPQWEVNFGNESKFSNSISIRPISNITESIPWEKVELRFTATTSEQDLSFTPNVSYPDEAVFVEGASFHLLIDGIKVIKVNGNCNEEITEQRFCSDNETPPTIGDLVSPIPNTTVTWFTGENNDEALLPPTILANNVTYWARSNNDPLLPRIEVKVILESGTPTGSSTQTFNEIDNPTIADLQATGSNIQWYSLESGETPLANSTALINNTSYYAAEGNSICRLQVLVTINTSGDGDCDILDGIVDGSFQDCALVSGSTQLSYNNNIECSGWQPINALSSPSTWIVDLSDPVSDLNPVMTSQVRQSPDRGIFASALVTHGRGTSNLTKGQGFKTTLNNLEIGKTYTISFYQSQGGSFDIFGNTTVPNSENILAQWNVSFGSETKSSDLIPIQSISDISVAPVWEKQEITFVPTATQQELSFSSFGSLINVVENVFYYNLLIDGIKVIKQNCNPVDPLVQEFCLSDGVPTINDLESPFLNSIAWFENETGGAPLPSAMEITETVTLWAEGNSTNPRVAVQIIIKEDCDGIAIQRFCILNGEVTIGDLQSPFPGSTASWYRTELDKALILPEYVIPESAIYWASSDENPSLPRVPVSIILNDQVPTGDTVQIFDEADAPTVADLQATGLNIQWYLSENGEVTLSNDTPLLHNTYYYAANGYSKCRLRVAVKIEGVITDCNILDQYVDGSFENCESIASSYGHNSNVTCGQWINGKGSADTWKFPFDASHSGIADNIQPSPDNGVAAGAIAKSLNTNELESFYTNLNGLNIGETYRIEFYQSNVTGNFDTTEGLEEARWKVIFGDQIQYSAYMVVSKNPVWQKSTLEFTANTTEARLEFNASSADKTTSTRYVYMLIDGIKLSQVTGGDTGCPDDIVYDTQSFCSMFEDPTVGDLLPPDGATDVLWYSSEVNGYQYSSEDILLVGGNGIPSTDVYWAESSQFTGRKPVSVVINEGIPTGNTLQVFDPLNNPTVANLQAIGNNVQWFASPTSQIPLLENVELIDGYTYYAGHNGLDCRLVVEVEIKLNSPDVNGIQILCASDLPTIGDLVAIPSDPSYTINWYDSIDAVTPLSEDTQIVNSRFYYVSQVTSNGSISDRISVYVSLISVSAPIGASEQTIYTNDGATVRNLVALGNGVLWYDSDGIQLSLDEPLEDGGIYYADQANISGTCRSIDRLAVRVRILPELPPQYFSCEKFRPQPGDKYVVSGWVRENGVTIASTETKSYSEISELFAKLLNELKDIIVTQTPVPPVYIPSPEDRTYDALVPYIKTTGIDNLTIYNLKPVKEDQDGFVRTVGFSFSFDEEGETTFTYKTPLNGFTSNNIYYSFPIVGNEDAISIDFTGLQTCTEGLCVNTNFVYNTVIVIIPISINYPQSIPVDNVLKESVDFNTYTPDPDYQAMTYANSLLKITYTDREGVELEDDGSVSFRPKGNIVDGWQRISTDFRIPDNAEFMTISLQSEDTNLNVYFDDIRFHPFNSNMKTFVYDPETQRLQSELDENNYATFYEYDKEGGLIRVKKETERGVYTIQETRSGNSKLNNN
ncbi:hypothetical protein [uncultured Aquimarina sp.]|uniref:leucine-rich repeat domain-containing protein n=1 Tax=uncultured Aquimarina sp. TaxID=575652 RepID=UPI00262FEAC4|nr:hypothetical protein [uncultured Aquimarina sp.]